MLKKIFNILTLLLVLIGLTSCENPIDPSLGGSNAFKEGSITIQLKDVPGADRCQINRTNLKTSEYMLINVNDYENNKNRTVTDYFTNPGDEYSYSITYYKNRDNGWENIETENKNITSYMGIGEIKLESYSKATYNPDTCILKFAKEPLLSSTIETFISNTPNCKKNIFLQYRDKQSNNWVFNTEINKNSLEVNLSNEFDDWREQFYGKPLVLSYANINFNLENLSYQKNLSDSELSQLFVRELIVKDNKLPLTFSYSSEGTVINIPQIDKLDWSRITRYTKDDNGTYNYSGEIQIISNRKTDQVTDYFVDGGKEYYYQIKQYDEHNNLLQKSKKTQIKGINGLGELRSCVEPIETYDSSTGIMTFTTLPKFNNLIEQLVSRPSTTNNSQNSANFSINYSYRPNQGDWQRVSCNIIEKTNFSAAIDNDNMFNQELTFGGIAAYAFINGIHYWGSDSNYNITDKTIRVPDTRCEILTKQTDKGIEITLPSEKPADADYLTIGRKSVNHPTNNWMNQDYIVINDLKNISTITDYFVTKGEKYQYKAFYIRHGELNGPNHIIKQSKTSEIEVTDSNFNGFLNPTTKVSYDNTTGIMNITPKPDLNIPIENSKVNLYLNYQIEDTDRYIDLKIVDGQIDISNSLYFNDSISKIPTYLKLNRFSLNAEINQVTYNQTIPKEDLLKIVPSLQNYETIRNIPDTREKTVVQENSNGIEILLGNKPTNCKKVLIYRSNTSENKIDEYSIQINSIEDKTSIIDYFVEPNKQYKYRIEYKDSDFRTINGTSYSEPITANNGMGKLTFENKPTVTYEPSSNLMTFDSLFDFSKQINSLNNIDINTNNWNYDVNVYYSSKLDNNLLHGWLDRSDQKSYINWGRILLDNYDYEKYFNQEFNLNKMDISVSINNNYYKQEITREDVLTKLPTLSKTITINDYRVPLEVKQNEKGIEIIIPTSILQNKNISDISIDRFGEGYSDNSYLKLNRNRNENFNIPNSMIDYFVEPNHSYEYVLNYYDGKTWYIATKKSNSVTAVNGCGELGLDSPITSATFDKSTGKQTIQPKQTYNTQIAKVKNASNNNNCNISMGFNYITRDIGQGIVSMDNDHDGVIDWTNSNANNKNQYIDFFAVVIEANVQDMLYKIWIRNDDSRLNGMLTNITKSIYINKVN